MKKVSPLLERYLKKYEENPESKVFAPLADGYRQLGMLDEAFAILGRGIRIHPDYVYGHLVLAKCYCDKGKWEVAYNVLRGLAPKNLENVSMQKLYGEVCDTLGMKDEALLAYKYLLFLNPRNKEISEKVKELEDGPIGVLKSKIVGSAKENLFNLDSLGDSEADQWQTFNLKKVKPEKKESPQVITHTLVDLYIEQGHHEKAKELLAKIQELNPQDNRIVEKLEKLKGLDKKEIEKIPVEKPREEEEKIPLEKPKEEAEKRVVKKPETTKTVTKKKVIRPKIVLKNTHHKEKKKPSIRDLVAEKAEDYKDEVEAARESSLLDKKKKASNKNPQIDEFEGGLEFKSSPASKAKPNIDKLEKIYASFLEKLQKKALEKLGA